MAAALALLARDRNGPKIALQVLINPSPDLTGNGFLVPCGDALDNLRWFARQYVEDPKDVYNPYVSPLLAADLRGLPPAVIILAERDLQREDGEKYAKRLNKAGVAVHVYVQKGVGHLGGEGARASVLARESLNVAAEKIRTMPQRS